MKMKTFFNQIEGLLVKISLDRWMHSTISAIIAAVVLITTELLGVSPLWCLLSSIAAIVIATAVKEFIIDDTPDPIDGVANAFGAWWVWTTYVVAIWG